MATWPTTANADPDIGGCGAYVGSRGKEVVGLIVIGTNANRNVYDHPAPGAVSASIQGRPISRIRELYGGDIFTLTSPTTGRKHRISLTSFADLDPDTTYVQIFFHFYPTPFASKEARLIRARMIREIRRAYQGAIDCHTGRVTQQEAEADMPPESRLSAADIASLAEHLKRKASAHTELAIHTGILLHHECAAINNEYAARQPDMFRPW